MNEFFSFKLFVSTFILKVIYIIGLISITISGFVIMFSDKGDSSFITGFVFLTLGNVIWRIICEIIILFFSLHEQVTEINRKLNTDTNAKNYAKEKDSFQANQKIENPKQIWECPKCNAKNPNTTFKCGHCGYSIV